MLAFAANSLLCRAALGAQLIDPASFTTIRTLAGAVTLAALALPLWRREGLRASPRGVIALFCYMACFSFAYVTLGAGTGALLLFGAVQLTMLAAALRGGERFGVSGWLGFAAAIAGLIWLVAPGVAAPEPLGAALMAGAGVAWGVYSLGGRTSQSPRGAVNAPSPLAATAGNFVYAVIPCA
ncbi:MAG TPA: EamA family transporter, partial [Gammaproteobacteria bacterium]|nr:EamA family transporter [Gammaproteobacteria bacterium]